MIKLHKKGFTIIELMIVLAIVAILVALAVPSFQDTIRKSRRSDALNAILDIHLSQERWRANHTTYGLLGNPYDPLADPQLYLGPDPLISPDGHYSLTVPVHTATTYTIIGAVVAGDDQENDSCGDFTLTFTAGVIAKTAEGTDAICWKK